jgi:hypothetical protein
MRFWQNYFVVLVFMFSGVSCWAADAESSDTAVAPKLDQTPRLIHIPKVVIYDINHEDYYFYRLLQLALHKSEPDYGPTQIEQFPFVITDKRLVSEVKQGHIDIIWHTTNRDYEADMLAIKIPLLKELTDYRLLLIRKDDQAQFSAVKKLKDLRKIKGGMNSQWPDYGVMKANRLKLVTGTSYPKLFKMLAAQRFDYFSRGIYQIQPEAMLYADQGLAVEQELILYYPNRIYFFVQKDQQELAQRLERGLQMALADGSFDELLNSIPHYRWAAEELKKANRRIIPLTNRVN